MGTQIGIHFSGIRLKTIASSKETGVSFEYKSTRNRLNSNLQLIWGISVKCFHCGEFTIFSSKGSGESSPLSKEQMPVVNEIRPRRTPETDGEYLEQMTKAIFQAGFSSSVIRNKWDNFRKAFDNFDVETVARYGLTDLERLASDKNIVRNQQKIAATVENALTMKKLIDNHGSFKNYLDSVSGDYSERAAELTRQFSHLGRTGVFFFLYCVNESVPAWDER